MNMKAFVVCRYGELTPGQRDRAWQQFYDAAGLLGIDVASDYRDNAERILARELHRVGPETSVTLELTGPTQNQFDPYDPASTYGGDGLR